MKPYNISLNSVYQQEIKNCSKNQQASLAGSYDFMIYFGFGLPNINCANL